MDCISARVFHIEIGPDHETDHACDIGVPISVVTPIRVVTPPR